jgi:hypothetical protein
MLHYKHKNALTISLRTMVALGSLAALSGTAAHAGLTSYDPSTGPASPLPNAATTAPYLLNSPGHTDQTITSPYPVTIGLNIATFTATGEPTGASAFEGFSNQVASGSSFDFPLGTHLLDTFDPNTGTITGPLQINFSSPVGSFVIKGQEADTNQMTDTQSDEMFTVSVYDLSNTLISTGTPCSDSNNGNAPCSFQTLVINNLGGNGKSVFLGAASTLANISRVVISDFSTDSNASIQNYHGNSNDVQYGPLTIGSPVPEASTMIGFGFGTLLVGGLSMISQKRKPKKSL